MAKYFDNISHIPVVTLAKQQVMKGLKNFLELIQELAKIPAAFFYYASLYCRKKLPLVLSTVSYLESLYGAIFPPGRLVW